MKTKAILILILTISISFTSCKKSDVEITPSGNVITESRVITGFNRLDIYDAFNIYVTFSESEESIQVEADDNLQAHILVIKSGDRLVVMFEDDIKVNGSATLNIHITLPELLQVQGEGAINYYFENQFIGNDLDVALTGASSLTGSMNLNHLNANIIGSSNLILSGQSQEFTIDALGASNMEGFDFKTNILEADLEGASNLSLAVNESMKVKASGASNVYYKGDAQITSQNLSGGSNIIKVQ